MNNTFDPQAIYDLNFYIIYSSVTNLKQFLLYPQHFLHLS